MIIKLTYRDTILVRYIDTNRSQAILLAMEQTYALQKVYPPPPHISEIQSQYARFVVLALVKVQRHHTRTCDRLIAHVAHVLWIQVAKTYGTHQNSIVYLRDGLLVSDHVVKCMYEH